jgi:hypothetical protein
MVQRKHATNEIKSGILNFLEQENKKWRDNYDSHVKSGRPAKNAQVYTVCRLLHWPDLCWHSED